MKKYIPLLFLFFSCGDGDLQIETIEFDRIAIQQCGTASETTQLFFKINETQVLLLNLQAGLLDDGVIGETNTQQSTIPEQSQLIYRIYSENATNAVFCDEIPPAAPRVIEEVTAESGFLSITTMANADDTAFEHSITLNDITLVNAKGERITDLSINDFGTVTTTISTN